jgi:hypothetical protein
MNTPKRHHWVPRFLLQNFCDASGLLWVQQLETGAVWQAIPENVFVERHRYSTIEEDGHRDPQLELDYARLEAAASPIVSSLIAAARSGSPPDLSPTDREKWDTFFYHQFKRVPAMTRQLTRQKSWEQRIEKAISKVTDTGVPADADAIANLRSKAGRSKIVQNATVKALGTPASDIVRLLLNRAVLVLEVASPGSEFVIGDRPIVNAGKGLASGAQMWLPLAPDVAVRPAFGSTAHTVRISETEVAAINSFSAS